MYRCNNERFKSGDGEDGTKVSAGGNRGDCLVSCMQMTWFCVVSWKKT